MKFIVIPHIGFHAFGLVSTAFPLMSLPSILTPYFVVSSPMSTKMASEGLVELAASPQM